ncbi:hypothetical protein GQ457_15G017830 [Hibiscus cannabinus]
MSHDYASLETKEKGRVGFEPTTSQLTADRSTTELLRKNSLQEADSHSLDQPMTEKNGTRGRRSTIHSRDSYFDQLISASCQFAK